MSTHSVTGPSLSSKKPYCSRSPGDVRRAVPLDQTQLVVDPACRRRTQLVVEGAVMRLGQDSVRRRAAHTTMQATEIQDDKQVSRRLVGHTVAR